MAMTPKPFPRVPASGLDATPSHVDDGGGVEQVLVDLIACTTDAAVLIDTQGVVLAVSPAAARILQGPEGALVGAAFAGRLADPAALGELSLLAGSTPTTLSYRVGSGQSLLLSCTATRVGGASGLLHLRITAWQIEETGAPLHLDGEMGYEIWTDGPRRALVRRVLYGYAQPPEGVTCHGAFAGRDTPCPGCPAFEIEVPGAASSAVLPAGELDDDMAAISARRLDPHTVRVDRRIVPYALFTKLVGSRVDRLCARAGLSEREREVLKLTVTGEQPEPIADKLGIASRTVRFHLANLFATRSASTPRRSAARSRAPRR